MVLIRFFVLTYSTSFFPHFTTVTKSLFNGRLTSSYAIFKQNNLHQRRWYAKISHTAGVYFQKTTPKTAKEVEERLLRIYYKHDERKDYLHNQSAATLWCMGINPKQLPALYCSLIEEFDLPFHFWVIYDCKTLRDMHYYICTELQIPVEQKTIRQEKAERKRAKQAETAARDRQQHDELGSKDENRKTTENEKKLMEDDSEDEAMNKELEKLLGYNLTPTIVSRQYVERRLMQVLRRQSYINQEALDTAGLEISWDVVGLDYKMKFKLIDALDDEFGNQITIPEFMSTIKNGRDVLNYYCELLGAFDENAVDKRTEEERIRGIRPKW